MSSHSHALPIAAFALAAVGCSQDPSYLFLGRRYVPERDCVATTVSMDVMSGNDPGNCAPRCVTLPVRDGGTARDTYATIMCGPVPVDGRETTDPPCAATLAALERKDTCLVDGGSSHPAPRDAGTD